MKNSLATKLSSQESRRYRRVAIKMPARIIINGMDDVTGTLINISPGDLAVKSDAEVVVGDAAVIYVDGLDVIEGRIARILPDGFAMSFLLSRKRRALLTEQLMLRTNGALSDGLEDRRAVPRHKVGDQRMVCRLTDGSSLFVRVIEMSVNGISVEAPRKPAVGASIHVGRMAGVVLRHTPRGFVVIYNKRQTEEPAKLRVV